MASASGKEERGLVVVTGASKGIGRSTALELAHAHHMHVLGISRDAQGLARLVEEGEGRIRGLALDITEDDAPRRIAAAIGEEPVRAVIHNAGLLHKAGIGEHDAAGLERCFRLNAIAPLLITQALLPRLAATTGSHVVHIGSMGGFQDSAKFPGLVGYSASKAALACMAQCLAEDLKPYGIRSNCLALGSADTEMLRAAFPGYQASMSAESMARFVAWFALNGHNQFNGRVLPVSLSTP